MMRLRVLYRALLRVLLSMNVDIDALHLAFWTMKVTILHTFCVLSGITEFVVVNVLCMKSLLEWENPTDYIL